MTVRAAWLQPSGQTREDTRITLSALLTPEGGAAGSAPLRSRGGIVPGGFALTGAAGMQCSVGPGRAVVQGAQTDQGAYMVAVTAAEPLTFADGDPLQGRIDLVELVVQDDDYEHAGASEARIRLVQGTPSATPAVPASGPGSTIPLYRVSVPAGTSAGTGGIAWATAVTPLLYPMVALGGITPTGGFDGVYSGQYRESGGVLQRWGVTAWTSYPKAVGGIAPNGAITSGTYTGQYRDNAGILQRWDGSAWTFAEGRSSVLFSVSQTAMQSIGSNTWTPVTLQAVDVDDATGWNGTNAYTVPRTGWWRVSAHIAWSGDSANGARGARVLVNETGVPRATWLNPAGAFTVVVGGQCLIRLTAGNTLQLSGYQSHTSAVRTLGGSGYATTLSAEWIKS
ncbi:hypothetical protein ACIBCM_19340 [Streptomyces sp. NPDC051018]|uniref:hypothetical protein n=1 Tax=Streptomyces sp. NPDC051018 TaxID=3365639 RepID=UPI00379BA76B